MAYIHICNVIKAAPSTHSRKNRLLLAIFSNFTNSGVGLCIHMLLFFSEINKINRNYFDFLVETLYET